MNILFHLYSHHPNCTHCMHMYYKMDQDKNGPGYCGIVSSEVEPDYFCTFYRIKPVGNVNVQYTPAKDKKPTDDQIKEFTDKAEKENKEAEKNKPKKL